APPGRHGARRLDHRHRPRRRPRRRARRLRGHPRRARRRGVHPHGRAPGALCRRLRRWGHARPAPDREPLTMRPARRVLRLARRYWAVTATLLVGLLGIVLAFAGAGAGVAWLFSGYALAIALWQGVGMVRQLLRREFGLDVLAVTAIIATILVGEYVASLLVVLMLTGGEALEDYAERRAKRELDALLARAPQRARVQRDGAFLDVPVDEVAVGELVLVRPSEVVPVDGVLVSPATTVDESSLTGESIPVEKVAGDALLSGSVNGVEAVELRATAVAADSQYQQIVALVAAASASQAPVVRLADRFAVPFTVFSLALAGVAWLV